MKDKYSVGEIAKIFQLSKQAIRYYDSLGLISPTEIDANNKYRYYSYNQFMDFALIKLLKDTGINQADNLFPPSPLWLSYGSHARYAQNWQYCRNTII